MLVYKFSQNDMIYCLTIVIIRKGFKDMYAGEGYGMYTIIRNECINSRVYNPCKEFM